MKRKLLSLLVLLMTVVTGAWAQNYLYLEVDPSDNTSATLKYGDPEGKPYYDGSYAQFWRNLGSPSVKTTVQTITVATSCASYGGVTFKSLFNGFSALTTITGLGTINAEEVTDMTLMFNGCSQLTSVDFSGLNTAKVTTMDRLFKNCSKLTSVNFSGLNMSSLNVMKNLFDGCTSLQTLDLSGFSTSSVTDMSSMFYGCRGLTTLTFGSGFNTASVTTMVGMFQDCSSLQSLDLSGFSTSGVTDMSNMFYGCSGLQTLDLSGLNTEKVTKMSNMFYGCSGLTTLTFGSSFNTSSVTDMSYMFYNCSGLGTLDLSGLNTSSVTTMSYMFRGCAGLQTLDLSGLNTSSVTKMSYMFSDCTGLKSVNFSGLNTSGVTTMTYMFQGCTGLQTLDLSGLNTSSVTDMRNMFQNCTGLQTLDISSFDTGSDTKMGNMFNSCSQLTAIFVGAGWSVGSSANSMFTDCTNLPNWDGTSNGTHANTGDDGYLNKVKVTANEGASGEFWATYYNEYKHLIAPTGTQVFKVALSGTTLAMNEITDRIVNKGQGVVLKGTSNSIILEVKTTASEDNYSGNSLQGTMSSINTTGANNYYVLNKKDAGVGFYKLKSDGTIGANKAYLTYSASAREFFSFDEATSIESVSENEGENGEVYDLQGRRVSQPTKGLYIVNGKKVVIK